MIVMSLIKNSLFLFCDFQNAFKKPLLKLKIKLGFFRLTLS